MVKYVSYIERIHLRLKMAGFFFTDNTMFLCGYSQHKDKITGFGGKKQNSELPYQTALRETLEELFEFYEIPSDLINELNATLVYDNILSSKYYTNFIMSFHDLQLILNIINKYNLKSKVYNELPKNFSDLIGRRQLVDNIEIGSLYFYPLKESPNFDFSLNLDISRYLKTIN